MAHSTLGLYRSLLKVTRKYKDHSYRVYAINRIRRSFQSNKLLQDPEEIARQQARARYLLLRMQNREALSRLSKPHTWEKAAMFPR